MNLQHRAAVLARTELFQGIDEATQRRIAEHVTERVFERGQCVFVQDEPGDGMFVLAEGAVKLYVASRDGGIVELVRHRPPAVFGEVALLDGGPRSATCSAIRRCVASSITWNSSVRARTAAPCWRFTSAGAYAEAGPAGR